MLVENLETETPNQPKSPHRRGGTDEQTTKRNQQNELLEENQVVN
jgi:hypothetical protein